MHDDPHFAPYGECGCECEDCVTSGGFGCICADCTCNGTGDHGECP